MQDITAASAKKLAATGANERKTSGKVTPLDSRYGKIGISAVAAAARYQTDGKSPACATESDKWRDLFADAAA
jgi:hypothetical protein